MNTELMNKLSAMGLRVEGPCGLPGSEEGVVIRHSLADRRIKPLEGTHKLTPSGPRHVIVEERS